MDCRNGVEKEGLDDWTPNRGYRPLQSKEKYSLVPEADGMESKQLMPVMNLCSAWVSAKKRGPTQGGGVHSVTLGALRLSRKGKGRKAGKCIEQSLQPVSSVVQM